MRNIVEYLKNSDEFNVNEFLIIDRQNETIVGKYAEGELSTALHELKRLKDEEPSIEYWIVGAINNGYYDLDDPGNYRVLTSREYNEKDEYYGINPKYNTFLR